MTNPITPNPAIHSSAGKRPLPNAPVPAQQLQAWAQNLLNAIVAQVVSALTFGAIKPADVINGLVELETWASNLFKPETFTNFLEDLWAAPGNFIESVGDVLMDGVHSVQHFLDGLWNGLTGGSSSNKSVAQVQTAAAALNATATTASTTASTAVASAATANTDIQATVDHLNDAFLGTTGSTGTSKALMRTRGAAVRATAITADTNASTAITNAATADAKAVTADSKAVTADGKAVTAQSAAAAAAAAASTADGKAVTAQSAAAAAASAASTADGKAVTADGKAVSAQATANTASTNASLGITNAATAQATVDMRAKDFTNLAAGSDFEVAHPWVLTSFWSIATDQFYSGTKSLKRSSGAAGGQCYLNVQPAVSPGEQFYIEFWARRDAAFNGSNTKLRVGHGVAETLIDAVNLSGGAIPAADTWTKFTRTITAPAGSKYLVITLIGDNTAGNVWIDDIVIRRVATPEVIAALPQSQITNLTTNLSTITTAAATADAKAVTADGKAVAAQSTANTAVTNAAIADAKAVAAQTLLDQKIIGGSSITTNPNFEDTAQYLGNTNFTYSTDQAYAGTRSAKFLSTAAYVALYGCTNTTTHFGVPVAPGQVYFMEVWVRRHASNVLTSSSSNIVLIAYFDGASSVIANEKGPTEIGSAGWYKLSGYVTVPAGATAIRPRVDVRAAIPAGDIYYFDSFRAVDVTDAYAAKLAADSAQATANTAVTNAATADAKAVTADGKAVTAQTAAATADAKAVTADGKAVTAQTAAATADGKAVTADGKAVVAQNALNTAINSGANLCVNSNFENTDYKLRDTANSSYSTEFKRSGTRSVKLIGVTGVNVDVPFFASTTNASLRLPVQAGDVLYFEAWVMGGTGNTKSAGAAGIRPYLYSGDPAAPTVSYPADIADYTGNLATLNAGWNKLSGYYTVPAGGVALDVVVQLHTAAGTGCIVHVDDMVCYRVTEGYVADGKAVSAQATANTASTNATLGITNAATADGKAVAAQATVEAVAASGNNMVISPNFEDTTIVRPTYSTHGVNANYEYTTEDKYQGQRSYKWTILTQSWNGPYLAPTGTNVTFQVKEGDTYSVKTRIKAKSTNTANGNNINLYLRWVNSADGLYVDNTVSITDTALLAAGGWVELNRVATCPAGRDRLQVMVLSSPGILTGNAFYLDAVSVREETTALNAVEGLNSQVTNGQNMVFDGGFENLNVWNSAAVTGQWSVSSTFKRNGSYALKCTANGVTQSMGMHAGPDGIFRLWPAVQSKKYYIEFWVYAPVSNVGTAGLIQVYSAVRNTASTWVYPNGGPGFYVSNLTKGAWTKFSGVISLDAIDAVHWYPYLRVDGTTTSGEFYFDDLYVTEWTGQQDIIDYTVQAVAGGTATGYTVANLKTNVAAVNSTATTASANASTAITNAATADAKAVAAQAILDAAISSGANLIPDPSFENTELDSARATCWSGNFSHSTTQKHSGTRSIKLIYPGGTSYPSANFTPTLKPANYAATGRANFIPTTVGRTYYVSQWVYLASPNAGNRSVEMYCLTYDDGFTAPGYAVFGATPALNTWTKMEAFLTITDADAAWMVPLFGAMRPGNDTNAVMYLDDLVLIDVTESYNAKLLADAAQAQANTATTNAATADAKAVTADGKAVTADGKAVTAQTNVQSTVDNIHQSINGGTATGNALSTIKSNFSLAWANFWDGLNGTTGATTKLPSEVKTVAAAVKSTATTASTNATTAITNAATADAKAVTADGKAVTADGKAVTADGKAVVAKALANTALQTGANLAPDGGFENSNLYIPGGTRTYSTEQKRTGLQSVKATGGYTWWNLFNNETGNIYIPCTEGDRFYAEVWFYGHASNTDTSTHTNYLQFGWFNAAGSQITVTIPTQVVGGNATKGVWTKISGYATAPAGTTSFLVTAVQMGGATPPANTYYWDDLAVYRVTESQYLIDNLYQGVLGGTSTGNTFASFKTNVASVSSTATTANTTAGTAVTNAATADGKAVAAQNASDTLKSITSTALSSGANIVTNPYFENTNFAGASGATYSTDVALTGTTSAKMIGNGTYRSWGLVADGAASYAVPCSAGDVFAVKFYVFGKATNTQTTGGANGIGCVFGVYNAAGSVISYPAVYVTASTALNSVWTEVSGTVTIPANGVRVNPYLQMGPQVTADTYYIDNVSIYRVTEAAIADAKAVVADGKAVTADGKAVVADGKAVTADGKAVVAQTTADVAKIAAINTGTNLCTNPGFESSLFSNYGRTDTAQKHSGTRSLKLHGGGSVNYDTSFLMCDNTGAVKVACLPGDVFDVEYWVYGKSTNVTTTTNLWVQFNVYDAAGTAFAYPTVSIVGGTALNSVWTKVSGTVVMPENAAFYEILLATDIACPLANEYWFDDVIVREVTAGYLAQDTADSATVTGLQNSSDILELKTQQAGGANSGYSATDTFNAVSTVSLDTANWNVQVAGGGGQHLGTNGADAYWVSGSSSPTGTVTEFDYWKTATNSDYQLVTMIVGTRLDYPYGTGTNEIYARLDSTRQNYIKLVYNQSSVLELSLTLTKVVAGVSTQLGYTTFGSNKWKAGDSVQLIAGTSGGGVRNFVVKRNGSTVIDVTDTAATLSVVGASNRYAGLGATGSLSGGGQFKHCGNIAAWSVTDNLPPTLVGSGFRAHRTSGNVTVPANSYNMLANSFFSLDYKTDDYTFAPATNNRLTVSISGWYHVNITIGLTINSMLVDMAAAVYKNGTILKKGGSYWGASGVVGRGPAGIQGDFIVYLSAGDYINPGYWQTTAYGAGGTMVGDSVQTYFEVALINKSLT